jgi:hypothetical protein
MSVVVRWEVGVKALAGVLWWSEDITRLGCIFLAYQDLKSRAGPCKVFAHPSRSVTLDQCLNAGTLERALGQVRLRAGTVLHDDNKLGVVHSGIVRPDEWEWWRCLRSESGGSSKLRVNEPSFEAQGKPHSKGVAILGAGASNQLQLSVCTGPNGMACARGT